MLLYMAVKNDLLTLKEEGRLRVFKNRIHIGCDSGVEKAS